VPQHRFRASRIIINQQRGHLAIMGKRPYLWKIRQDVTNDDGAVVHHEEVLTVLHNPIFSQVVSVDVGGQVIVWELGDGRQSFAFRIAHPTDHTDSTPVGLTSAILDYSSRFLIVGFLNGDILTYNFQSGLSHNQFVSSADPLARTKQVLSVLFELCLPHCTGTHAATHAATHCNAPYCTTR